MRKLMAVTTLTYFFGCCAFAGSPISISFETKGLHMVSTNNSGFENEIILNKKSKKLEHLNFGLENLFCYEKVDRHNATNEITISAGVWVWEFLSLGIAHKTFLETEHNAFALDGILYLEQEIKEIGFQIICKNEFIYNITENIFKYMNTIQTEKSFPIKQKVDFIIVLENELIIGETYTNMLMVGPCISVGDLSIYVNNILSISEEKHYGIEAGFVFEL